MADDIEQGLAYRAVMRSTAYRRLLLLSAAVGYLVVSAFEQPR